VLIFLVPPSFKELRSRLEGRGTESQEVIEGRIQRAGEEIRLIESYDYMIINDLVENAVSKIEAVSEAEKMRVYRNLDKAKRIEGEI